MLRQCANPSCAQSFRYGDEGELFVFGSRNSRPERTFWLCGLCALHFAVIWEEEGEPNLVPHLRSIEHPHTIRNAASRVPRSAASPGTHVVLCVDDHEAILHFCRQHLESHGYCVLTALNGPDGLRALQAYPVDVLLLDYSMPEMNGEEVALEVRHMYPKLPIVLISASAVDDDWSVLERVDAYIPKEELPKRLLGTLQGLLLDPVGQNASTA